MKRSCLNLILVVAAAAGVAACSGGSRDAQDHAGPSQWLAVARGKVDVEGGLVLVAARADGVVESVSAEPGDAVKAGQVLARLDPRAAKIQVATAQAGVAQAKAQLAESRVSLRQARQRAPRIAAAAQAGAATGDAAEHAHAAVMSLEAKQSAATAGLDAARQQLAAARLALDATSLRAPVAGTLVARRIAIGQTVSSTSGQPLFELLPERPHIVNAQVDADVAGSIHAGMHADVVRDSGSGPVYHATVLRVGQVLQPDSLTRDPLTRAISNDVDCTLVLEPARADVPPLRIGQRVLVKFPRAR